MLMKMKLQYITNKIHS